MVWYRHKCTLKLRVETDSGTSIYMWWLFGISAALLAYTYAGYPVAIWLLSRYFNRPVAKGCCNMSVSVLIAARNEAETLPQKLENLLELARREPIREIWIGLDGCSDGTASRVRELLGKQWIHANPIEKQDRAGIPRVEILEFERSRGKASVLNDLMTKAAQPVFIMMDARQQVVPGAVSRLLEPFADPCVGVVSGALVYESAESGAQKGAESYWGYEKFIRHCESRYWAVPGATGALYAIRHELCRPIPENTLVDDVLIPMRAVMRGFRCLFEPSAMVLDHPSIEFRREGLRKRRTLAGIWQLLRLEPELFSFRANPIWFQWISHKFLRLLSPFLLVAMLLSLSLRAGGGSPRATTVFCALLAGFGFSAVAYAGGRGGRSRWLGLAGAFFGVNWCLFLAALDAWTGHFDGRWKK